MKNKADEYWKDELTDEQFQVLRQKATEQPFSGALLNNEHDGYYNCSACGARLFASDDKYDSGSGWPSFTEVANSKAVELHEDKTLGMVRTEAVCANCGGHLGHVFPDGPSESGQRYCINSLSLDFEDDKVDK